MKLSTLAFLTVIFLSACNRHTGGSSASDTWKPYDNKARKVFEANDQVMPIQFANQSFTHITIPRDTLVINERGDIVDSSYIVTIDVPATTECLLKEPRIVKGSIIYKMEFKVTVRDGKKKEEKLVCLYYTGNEYENNGKFKLLPDPQNPGKIKVSIDGAEKPELAIASGMNHLLLYSYKKVTDGENGKAVNNSLPGRH